MYRNINNYYFSRPNYGYAYANPYRMNFSRSYPRVVVYEPHNFDRLKRFEKDIGEGYETDPNKLLAGVSDRSKRLLIEEKAQRAREMGTDPDAIVLDKALRALWKEDQKLRKIGVPMEDRRALLAPYYKTAEKRQARYNTSLARAVASEFMPQNLKKK